MNQNMFRGMGSEGPIETGSAELTLVSAKAGLTNYVHTPVIRNPDPYMNSTNLDELATMVKNGTCANSDVNFFAAESARLNPTHSGLGEIRGGWSEYNKGMMKMTFRVQTGGLSEEYVSVIGYVTGNGASDGLTSDALFTPVFSWKHYQTLAGDFDLFNQSQISNVIGMRTDYLINDGSSSGIMVSMRPGDVIDQTGDVLSQMDVKKEIIDNGIPFQGFPTKGTSNIEFTGIVPSKRSNYNATQYTKELLSAAVNVQKDTRKNSSLQRNHTTSLYDAETQMLAEASKTLMFSEPTTSRDNFLSYIKSITGDTTWAHFKGWRISDLASFFDNFGEALSTELMGSDRFEVIDFTEIARMFGSNSEVEAIAQEINFTTLELLVKNGLGAISVTGSNCDHYATEDALSNIVIMPHEPASLKDDDPMLFQNAQDFAEGLKTQLLARLNGRGINTMTPIRFEVSTELFGTTQVWITLVDPNNPNQTTIHYSFPTYAPSPYSPVFGHAEDLNVLAESVYGGIKSYFMS